MATSRQEYENSIINSLKVTDPAMNTGLGTPIRKIISAVALELANASSEFDSTRTLYAIESLSGTELDALVAQFGFTRQEAKASHGIVTITRDNGDNAEVINYGTQFYKPATSTEDSIFFQSTSYQRLDEGVLTADVSVRCVTVGTIGNVAANTITYGYGSNGSYSVTNETPMTGGRDAESDTELRSRFLETVFRNVSGTKDQYLGLAMAHAKNTRANFIGQSSRYSEIVQVKKEVLSDGFNLYVETSFDADNVVAGADGYLSNAIDEEKRLWLTNQDTDTVIDDAFYSYNFDVDNGIYRINFKANTATQTFGYARYGGIYELAYRPLASVESVTLLSSGTTLMAEVDYIIDLKKGTITINPESTTGISTEIKNGGAMTCVYKAFPVAENDFVRFEFDYLSNINRGGLKTTELYIDGVDDQKVSDIQYLDVNKEITADNYKNWIREDGTFVDATAGHLVVPLSYQPLSSGSGYGEANVGTSTILTEGKHFNILRDNTVRAGSVDACDALELIGASEYNADSERWEFKFESGDLVLPDNTPMNIPYFYNKVVESVQNLVDGQSIVTMDTEVHGAKRRYFGIYLAVMYSIFPRETVSETIKTKLRAWAATLPFGAQIQLSDIETVAANSEGVDNVRIAIKDRDSATDFGIAEFTVNGSPMVDGLGNVIAHYNDDFKINENEIFEIQFVNIQAKSQQSWNK